jgi:tRNA uridine 5-carbamoylmethylation protein Kti12
METKIINLFGGPGVGKSTIAASVFSNLKQHNIDCELAMEYAKDMIWEESLKTLDDQIYVFAKQHHRQFRLLGKVEYIITDSPIVLSVLYDKKRSKGLYDLIKERFECFNNINYLIRRGTIYQPNGRIQTEDEAKRIDANVISLLDDMNIKYTQVSTTDAIQKITEDILKNNI